MSDSTVPHGEFSEEVTVAGHIIDSLILPKILDEITAEGGRFDMTDVRIGHTQTDPSAVTLTIRADDAETLERILASIQQHGASLSNAEDATLVEADMDGAFPEGFYCTSNLKTELRVDGEWQTVRDQEMDCGIVYDRKANIARCVPMSDVRRGELVVVGRAGTRLHTPTREAGHRDAFGFMNSAVSSEKPKSVIVREIAAAMRAARDGEGRILIVGGPAIVHTGSREHLSWLIRERFVDVLFAGNALATHDIEQSLYGTSLGISMRHGGSIEEGHEHHLRSINAIRRAGSIKAAVESGLLTDGVMADCVRAEIPFVLAGSIRDDGPLPDVITDVIEAQRVMRKELDGVTFALMIATTLHSIAVGNLLPAAVRVVCVDINPATVTKLADRGTFQTVGLVTDVEPFLRVLVDELKSGQDNAS